jgi:aerobic-type carbon monoxide dehydrogenase small subunit (CoxS/CutS family)
MITLTINGRQEQLDLPPDTPLLWVIRDQLGLTGTKFGCGAALCGACTVHVDGEAVRSCSAPIGALDGRKVVTIEGLAASVGREMHPVQQAWIEEDVVQCGYCHSGQIMSAAALLAQVARPTDADIDGALGGNICRCGTYERIRAGIHKAAEIAAAGAAKA